MVQFDAAVYYGWPSLLAELARKRKNKKTRVEEEEEEEKTEDTRLKGAAGEDGLLLLRRWLLMAK